MRKSLGLTISGLKYLCHQVLLGSCIRPFLTSRSFPLFRMRPDDPGTLEGVSALRAPLWVGSGSSLVVTDANNPSVPTPPGSRELLADIQVKALFNPHRFSFLDVRVADPASGSRLGTPAEATLNRAEQEKRGLYEAASVKAHCDFSPFVLSVHGSFALVATTILKRCAGRISGGRLSRDFGSTLRVLKTGVQAAAMRGVAQCLLGRTSFDSSGARKGRQAARHATHYHLLATVAGL
eukprot:NODE_2125_length_1199_cov_10.934783_g798_i2.p2 GENE.NODE_2125_length_1199_cov_10.934783_g798_i2~~NODE_2125_length_1199_cov_10.934783_g798_i2.p2  ORF type:complete len:247 (-),score=2.39 NODE_2125_length_1199_cov_10.934783_g798_i2:457-1167(-)